MYTEYIYSDRQYETIEKNIKAYLFDIITKEQQKMVELSNKLVSAESPELQEQIKEVYMENDKCVSSLLALSSELAEVIKKLDMVARNYNFVEDKNTPQLIANVSLNGEVENKATSGEKNDIDSSSIEKANDNGSESVVGDSVVIPTVANTSNENNVAQDDNNNGVSEVSEDVPVIGNIVATTNESKDATIENSTSSVDTGVTPVATSNSEVPQIISNVDTSIDNSDNPEKQLVFEKNDVNQAKAILTTGKQVSKLRESRDSQNALLIAESFFKTNENKTEASSDEVIQVTAAGLLDQNTQQNTQQQIEQLMTQANDLYQAGNVVESQKLYDQISQLNQTLKQE